MSMPENIDGLDGFFYSAKSLAELWDEFEGERAPDLLTQRFAAFHRALDIRISELVNADPLQSIVFSDSAFVIFRDLNTAIYFAQALMRNMISLRVPVRVGIGRGTYRGLRLTTDISDEVRRHSSQFLGTGVIRAHQAEACGLKGLRIFVHPDSEMKEDWPGDLCVVTDGSAQRSSPPVVNELNYLWHDPDFTPIAGGAQTADEANDDFVSAVIGMMELAPDHAFQYQQTLAAITRMRAAYRNRGQRESLRH